MTPPAETSKDTVPWGWSAYRSMQVPGILAPTLRVSKPLFSNTLVYQGLRPAERRRTLPPVFKARCNACTWVKACESWGQNQSMLSMTYYWSCQPLWMESAVLGGLFWSYYGVAKGAWCNSTDHFLELVGMNTESVECAWLREFAMCSV